jgi:hypothetical protein
MRTSVRDLIITGWIIIFIVTVGVVAIHPAYQSRGLQGVLMFGGASLIGTLAGIGLIRFTELVGRSSSRMKAVMLGIFVVGMIPLVPVMYFVFAMPWAALIIITLVYVRWRWAVVPSVD